MCDISLSMRKVISNHLVASSFVRDRLDIERITGNDSLHINTYVSILFSPILDRDVTLFIEYYIFFRYIYLGETCDATHFIVIPRSSGTVSGIPF
jgi:hypothetical protein